MLLTAVACTHIHLKRMTRFHKLILWDPTTLQHAVEDVLLGFFFAKCWEKTTNFAPVVFASDNKFNIYFSFMTPHYVGF